MQKLNRELEYEISCKFANLLQLRVIGYLYMMNDIASLLITIPQYLSRLEPFSELWNSKKLKLTYTIYRE